MPLEISFNSTATVSGHTEYGIVIINSRHGIKKHLVKRYSEMFALHKKLGKLGFALPAFPPKKVFGNLDPNFVKYRQVGLQNYFRSIVRVKEIRKSQAYKEFLEKEKEVNGSPDMPSTRFQEGGNDTDVDSAMAVTSSAYS